MTAATTGGDALEIVYEISKKKQQHKTYIKIFKWRKSLNGRDIDYLFEVINRCTQ